MNKEGEHIPSYENKYQNTSSKELHFLDVLLKNSYDYIFYKDRESRFIKLNDKAAWALGAESPDDAIGKSDYDFFPDIAEQTRADERRIMETGIPQLNEMIPVEFADGKQHWLSVSKVPYYDAQGNVQGIVGISRDITKDKEMELQIRDKTRFLQKILDPSPNCIYVKDKQGRYIIANKTIANLYQTTPEEMIGKKDDDFAHQAVLKPNEAEFFKDIDKKAIETKQTQIIPSESFTYDDGSIHYFFTTKTPISYQDEPDCVMGISVDITKLKEKERQAQESERKFHDIFNKSTIGYSLTKPDGTLSELNNAFASILGYSIEELSNMNFEDITHPDDILESKECVKHLLSGAQDSYRFEKRYYHKNGNIVWVDLSTTLMRDRENNPLFFITSIQDITEKKEAGKKIQRFFDMSSELIGEADINTATFTKINPAFTSVLGYSEKELLSQSFLEFIHPEDKEPTQNVIDEQLQRGEKVLSFINRYRCKDGSYVWLDWNSVPVPEEGIIYAVARDISDKKKADEYLKDNEEKYRLLTEQANEVIFSVDLHTGQYEYMSPCCEKVFGVKPEEFYQDGALILKIVPKDAIPFIHEAREKVVEGTIEPVFDFPIIHQQTKEKRWLRHHSTLIKDDTDRLIRLRASVYDITSEKNAQETLQQSEEKYRLMFEMSPIGITTADKKGNIVDINQAGAAITGHTREELIGKSYKELHFIDKKMILKILKDFPKIIQGKTLGPYEIDVTDLDGNNHILDVRISPIRVNDKFTGTQVTMYDVTDKKNAERAFNERLKALTGIKKIREKLEKTNDYENTVNEFVTEIAPQSMQYPEKTYAKVLFDGKSYCNHPNMREEDITYLSKPIVINQQERGKVIIGYTEDLPFIEKYEDELIWNYAEIFKNYFSRIESQIALSQSERKYRNYIDNAPNGVFIADQKGRYLEVNDKAVETTGYSREELLHMSILDFIPDWGKEQGLRHFQILLENGQSFGESPFIHKDGSVRWWQVNAVKLSENRFLGFTQDITKGKIAESELKETRKRLELAMDASEHGFWDWNLDTDEIYFSPRYCTMLGYEPDELPMKIETWVDLMHPDDKKDIVPLVQKYVENAEPYSVEFRLRCKDGSWKWIAGRGKTYEKDNRGVSHRAVGTHVDITERKLAEKELKEIHDLLKTMNTKLEQKVEERTQEVEQLLKQKDEFVNQLGHDLKNPLGPLLNLLPVLKNKETNPESKEIIDVLMRNTAHMKILVTKTIQLAQLNAPSTKLVFEDVNLVHELKESIDRNRNALDGNNMTIDNRIPDDIIFQADKLRLSELFDNLFNNAIKYTDGPGTITIDAKEDDNGFVTVSVKDTGIGMNEEHLCHLFEEFYKADSSRHDFDSSGLGMPICKRIVELHGGKIWAESEGLGKGSTFYFTLRTVDNKKELYLKTDESNISQSNRIEWIDYNDKKILYLDYSNLGEMEYQNAIKEIGDYITRIGEYNLLVLTNINNNHFSLNNTMDSTKIGTIIKPYIKKNAIVGSTKTQQIFMKSISLFSGIEIKPFDNIDDAKDWLIE